MEVKGLGPVDKVFFRDPTETEILADGLFIARRKSIIAAERRSSRLLSAMLAMGGGAVINFLNNPDNIGEFVSNLVIPITMQVVAEVRSERTQGRELKRLYSFPEDVLEVLNKSVDSNVPRPPN
jgi:hypothetical protein